MNITTGTKILFEHTKNIPNNYAIYEVIRIDYLLGKEYIRSIDDRGALEFDAKQGYIESLIDLKKYCGWTVSIY